MTRRPLLLLLAVALGFCLLNAAKPLVVDDYAYVATARQIAAHPLDPFGFELFWGEAPLPAHAQLLTPVLPYALAPALLLFGEQPWLWKLWLFPFALGLALALHALAKRVAPGLESLLLPLLLFSPALLPAFNLMLDVPMLALHLGAVALFLTACDRRALGPALAAGLLAGLAAQTKYTGLAAFAVIALCALLRRFWLGGALALTAGALVFAAWELFLWRSYGHTMLLGTAGQKQPLLALAPGLAIAGVVGQLGGLAPAVPLLALGACRSRRARVVAVAALHLAVPIAIALAPRAVFEPLWAAGFTAGHRPPELLLYLPLGVLSLLLLAWAWRARPRAATAGWPLDTWLLGWLLLETVALLGMTPFFAARRALGMVTVVTLVAARAVGGGAGVREPGVRAALALSIGLGLLIYGVDHAAATATRSAVSETASRLSALGASPPATIWYVGHWSFQYYAERNHWRSLVPGRSHLRTGDWLVRPGRMSRQPVVLPRGALERLAEVRLAPFPLTTIPHFYETPVPLGRLWEAQAPVTIERVRADVVAGSE